MTSSPARIRANRRNAQRSTGPRSRAGKARVSRNALRHGLSLPGATIPEADAAAAELAHLIAGIGADLERHDLARRVADAELDLSRVRRARIALLQQPLETLPARNVRKLWALLRSAAKALETGGAPFWQEGYTTSVAGSDETETQLASIIAERSQEFERLDRYERRALSRRRFAVRALDALMTGR